MRVTSNYVFGRLIHNSIYHKLDQCVEAQKTKKLKIKQHDAKTLASATQRGRICQSGMLAWPRHQNPHQQISFSLKLMWLSAILYTNMVLPYHQLT